MNYGDWVNTFKNRTPEQLRELINAINVLEKDVDVNGEWDETKVTPDLWKIRFRSLKSRQTPAPEGSGVPLKTSYHWFIMADQQVTKTAKDDYQTVMQGLRFKVGGKRHY